MMIPMHHFNGLGQSAPITSGTGVSLASGSPTNWIVAGLIGFALVWLAMPTKKTRTFYTSDGKKIKSGDTVKFD